MIAKPTTMDDEYSYCLHMQGCATVLHGPPDDYDLIKELRKVVEEVTGKPVEEPPKPRIGFLP